MKIKKILVSFIVAVFLFSVCGTVLATTPPEPASSTITFTNPLEANSVQEALGSVLGYLQGIIVVLALIFIVVGAILYITSAGDDKKMQTAKGAITAAMVGLAIGVAAPSFLKEIYSIVGTGDAPGELGAALTLTAIAMNALNFLLSLVGVLGIIMLVVGGMMYVTSAGDEDRAETGKKIIKYAIVGIIVALTSLVVVRQIAAFFAT